MDKIPLSFDSPPNRTVNNIGEKTISITTTGNKKTSFLCVSVYWVNGQKFKPLVIFKRKTIPKGNFSKYVVVQASKNVRTAQGIF